MIFTTQDYKAAIQRELKLRDITYPKLLKKQVFGTHEWDIVKAAQNRQDALLIEALNFFWTDKRRNSYRNIESGYYVLSELVREYNMQKKCSSRFVFYKRMTKDTVRKEIAVWEEMIRVFSWEYPITENYDLKFLKTKISLKRNYKSGLSS